MHRRFTSLALALALFVSIIVLSFAVAAVANAGPIEPDDGPAHPANSLSSLSADEGYVGGATRDG